MTNEELQTDLAARDRVIQALRAQLAEAERKAEDRVLSVTRLEVINAAGRVYVRRPCAVTLSFSGSGSHVESVRPE